MLFIPLTDSTEKQGTFSAGASQRNYNDLSSRSLSHDGKDKFRKVLLSLALPTLTDDTSASILEERVQSSINQIAIDKSILQNETVRRIFLQRSVANFQYLQEIGTSTFPSIQFLSLNSIPYGIRESLDKLSQSQESEGALYEVSSLVADWLIDAPNEHQKFIAEYIQNVPLINSRILMSALSDAEFSTRNGSLLFSISLFLNSTDKRLAQTAATFLLTCGGSLGKYFLEQTISMQNLPHAKLIKGISELLS